MHYLIYVSSAAHLMNDGELTAILRSARRNNTARGVTGMLLYKDGSFMQLLEGEKDDVRRTYERIALDPRHHGLIVLRDGESAGRLVNDWSMGFQSVRAADLEKIDGYAGFGRQTFTAPAFTGAPHVALKALKVFYETTTGSPLH